MPPTYTEFRTDLFLKRNFPTHGKVYYFPNNVLNIAQRVALDDDASFNSFIAAPNSNKLLLYMWKYAQDGSPKKEPADEADSQSQVSGGSQSQVSDGSRGPQKNWALAVKKVDENKCVVCQSQDNLAGAHIVPASQADLQEANLASAYDVCNGVTLCGDCHHHFDRGLFYFDTDGKLVVSAALIAKRPEWKDRQGTSIHRTPPRKTARHWPDASMIDWRIQNFTKRQRETRRG